MLVSKHGKIIFPAGGGPSQLKPRKCKRLCTCAMSILQLGDKCFKLLGKMIENVYLARSEPIGVQLEGSGPSKFVYKCFEEGNIFRALARPEQYNFCFGVNFNQFCIDF